MLYSSIDMTTAAELPACAENVTFVRLARTQSHGLHNRFAYCTDDYGLRALFVPAVYRDLTTTGYLAGYRIVANMADTDDTNATFVVDQASLYLDAESAAVAAHTFADDAAECIRTVCSSPSPIEITRLRRRGSIGPRQTQWMRAQCKLQAAA